uniref:Uncharacterized protein n=1 Tax=Arundo donax TaxID=35708 RepID=A0A0A9G0B4_ARUDO
MIPVHSMKCRNNATYTTTLWHNNLLSFPHIEALRGMMGFPTIIIGIFFFSG